MALVADTRFLLTYYFPPNKEAAEKIQKFMISIVDRLIIPTIVVVEFIKIAGKRMGYEASRLRIRILESRGSKIVPFTTEDAYIAGEILLKKPNVPFADVCIASIAKRLKSKVISDDPHFKELEIPTIWPF